MDEPQFNETSEDEDDLWQYDLSDYLDPGRFMKLAMRKIDAMYDFMGFSNDIF